MAGNGSRFGDGSVLNKTKKDKIVSDVRRRMRNYHEAMQGVKAPIHHFCLFWSSILVDRLREERIYGQLQAGSVFWERVKEDIKANEYGFGFRYDHQAIIDLSQGLLPEMHVWVVIPGGRHETIDLLSWAFKVRCLADNHEWNMPDPPPYLWCYTDEIPKIAAYIPNEIATEIANQIVVSTKPLESP